MPFIGLYLLLNVLSNYGVHHENNQTTDDERCRALVTHNTQAGRKQLLTALGKFLTISILHAH